MTTGRGPGDERQPMKRNLTLAPMFLVLAIAVVWSCNQEIVEGQHAGDCSDGADNDMDGLFDCDDDTCAGSPVCDGPGDDDDTSSSDDDDTSSSDDDDSMGPDDDDSSPGGGSGTGEGEGQSENCRKQACPECTNGTDDDGDGLVDCDDDGCSE